MSKKITFEESPNNFEALSNMFLTGLTVCEYNKNFNLLYVNQGFLDLTGYTWSALSRMGSYLKLIPHDHISRFHAELERQLHSAKHYSLQYPIVTKSGETIWVLDRGMLIQEPGGQPQIYSNKMDWTAHRNMEIELTIGEKRNQVLAELADMTLFDYNPLTLDLSLLDRDSRLYGVPTVVPNGPKTLIDKGIIEPSSISPYREMYRKIHSGAPSAQCFINTKDVNGVIHDFQLTMTNVFNEKGVPIRTIGVRRNVTQLRQLQREKQYGSVLASNHTFAFEANVTQNYVIKIDDDWGRALGVLGITDFLQLKAKICDNSIDPKLHKLIQHSLSEENLVETYVNGERMLYVDFRRKIGPRNYHWFRMSVNIIQDEFSDDLIVRCYLTDINDMQIKNLKIREEQKLYERLIDRAAVIYEVNISQDVFISGNEKWPDLFGIVPTDRYSEMMHAIEKQAVHPEDVDAYHNAFLSANLLRNFKTGDKQIVCEYRRPDENGAYIWVRCVLHLYEDVMTSDIKGHAYIEDINEEKKKELALIYRSEHDALTDLLNKESTEKYIADFLLTAQGKAENHAFFIIDVDYFKAVNDNFGHAFGDVVLSKVAGQIRELFRDGDIVGRVGGDEFAVLMKNVHSQKIARTKAQEICDKVNDAFEKSGIKYIISLSIGLAFTEEHGKTYRELFGHSDTALYVSKQSGRNCYTIYNKGMTSMESNVKAIDQSDLLESRSFEDNIAQYMFQILYENADKDSAIKSVLELMGKHFNVSRTYIFEHSPDHVHLNNTYEWCNTDIIPQIDRLQRLTVDDIGDYSTNFNRDGIFYLPDAGQLNTKIGTLLEEQEVKSMLQFSIVKNGTFMGFVGFDYCAVRHTPSRKEISWLQNISNILAVFVLEMRASMQNQLTADMTMSVINGFDSYVYVCNPDNYQLLFVNNKTLEVAPDVKPGQLCHEVFWNRDAPCDPCPMQQLVADGAQKNTMELYNTHIKIWAQATASWVDWLDGTRMCLIDSVDITKYIDKRP